MENWKWESLINSITNDGPNQNNKMEGIKAGVGSVEWHTKMAMVESLSHTESILFEIEKCQEQAEKNRLKEYRACTLIQANVRRYFQQKRYREKLNAIRLIQSYWQAYREWIQVQKELDEKAKVIRLRFYDSKATKIQAAFKGYISRRDIFDFYRWKQYLATIEICNEETRQNLQKYKEENQKLFNSNAKIHFNANYEQTAKETHYLKSTKNIPGIHNNPYKEHPDYEEILYSKVKLDPPKRNWIYETLEEKAVKFPCKLPPIKRIQGPFKAMEKVMAKRYQPIKETIRISEKYDLLDEKRREHKRLNRIGLVTAQAEPFVYSKKIQNEMKPNVMNTLDPYVDPWRRVKTKSPERFPKFRTTLKKPDILEDPTYPADLICG
ncbi:hypothetical protein SNEBB_006595 [Seison nebaliae]|nr:hypothetical protein SNEBB_006595 [Seison nebaliae]